VTSQSKLRATLAVASILAASVASISTLATSSAQSDGTGGKRGTLWAIVRNVCVAGELLRHNPTPCISVDLRDGVDKGFALLAYPGSVTHLLLVPTTPIAGIESPELRQPDSINYFALAWDARMRLSEALNQNVARDSVGLAVNSALSRSQDQLHIHLSCVKPKVREALHEHESSIKTNWARFEPALSGHHYMARWVPGEHLTANPFILLADVLQNPVQDMPNETLAIIGMTRANGAEGFVLLEDQVRWEIADFAGAEELLDLSCRGMAKASP
jgi:CDP-diacylglycerol pyrophosphatase